MHSFLMTTAWPDTGSSMEPFKRTAPLISVVVECDVVLDMLNPPNRFHPDMAILISGLAKIRTKYRLVVHELCRRTLRSEEHTSELQSLMRISYAVFFLNTK